MVNGPTLKCSRSAPASGASFIGVSEAMSSVLGDTEGFAVVEDLFDAALGLLDEPHAPATSTRASAIPTLRRRTCMGAEATQVLLSRARESDHVLRAYRCVP